MDLMQSICSAPALYQDQVVHAAFVSGCLFPMYVEHLPRSPYTVDVVWQN